jgi:threonine/homoserine/homoserine lactone efflux protein
MLLFLTYTFGKQALSGSTAHLDAHKVSNRAGFAQGFLIAIFNPKILAWMLAIYAPFIKSDLGIPVLLGMAAMGMIIDMAWYVTVATFFTSGNRAEKLRAASSKLDAAMAALMLTFVILLLLDVL